MAAGVQQAALGRQTSYGSATQRELATGRRPQSLVVDLLPEVAAGDALFNSIGCAACHTPVLMTGPNPNPTFDRKRVELYSDLLLHDVDTGDGIEQLPAEANEIRTPALWGLRFRRPLLHDGSAGTVEDAIKRHGGEAKSAIDRFTRLSGAEQRSLSAFLSSL